MLSAHDGLMPSFARWKNCRRVAALTNGWDAFQRRTPLAIDLSRVAANTNARVLPSGNQAHCRSARRRHACMHLFKPLGDIQHDRNSVNANGQLVANNPSFPCRQLKTSFESQVLKPTTMKQTHLVARTINAAARLRKTSIGSVAMPAVMTSPSAWAVFSSVGNPEPLMNRFEIRIMTAEYISNFSVAIANGLLTLVNRGKLVATCNRDRTATMRTAMAYRDKIIANISVNQLRQPNLKRAVALGLAASHNRSIELQFDVSARIDSD